MIKPLGDRVVLKIGVREQKTVSGIVLPDTVKEKPSEAEVVAVGPGKQVGDRIVPLEVQVGDWVIFSKYAGTEIKQGDTEYLVVREGDILAVIEG